MGLIKALLEGCLMSLQGPSDHTPSKEPFYYERAESKEQADILEKFVRQLSNLTRLTGNKRNKRKEDLYQTVAEVQATADDILRHFTLLKAEISNEVDARLRGAVAETIDPAIEETLEMKKSLSLEKEEDPNPITEGNWAEQMARWVHLYSKWKGKEEVSQKVMETLAKRIDLLIEKDLQFIEQYEKQSLSHLEEDPSFQEDVKRRIQSNLDTSIRKLKALKGRPPVASLQEAIQWDEAIQKKRGSYLDRVLEKIESIIDEEAPFANEPTNITDQLELKNECDFLEKEVDHALSLLPRTNWKNDEEVSFIESRLSELRGYAEELLEASRSSSIIHARLKALLKKIPSL